MTAIMTVVGPDRVGIIAEVCTTLARLFISVDEISQTIMDGTFTMIMRVHGTEQTPDFLRVQDALTQKGLEMGLAIRVQREDIFNAMHTI